MRARDVRAISFCAVSSLLLLGASLLILDSYIVGLALTAAYVTWLLTRPRMLRVLGRLRGDPDWSAYFDNDGSRFSSESGPEEAGPKHHPAGRP